MTDLKYFVAIMITVNMAVNTFQTHLVLSNQHTIIEQNEVLQGFLEVNMDEYCYEVNNDE